MKRQTKTNLLFAAIATITFLFAAQTDATAQERQRQFQPGETVQVGPDEFYRIFQCRGAGDDEDCEIIVYDKNNQPTSRKMWTRAYIIRGGEARFKEANEVAASKERLDAKQKAGTFATTAQPKFQPGEYIDMGEGSIYEILECRGAGENAQCRTQAYRDGGAANVRVWQYVSDLRAAVERVRFAKKREAGERGETPNTGGNPNQKQPTQNDGATTEQGAAECSFEPPAPKHSNSAGFSVGLAKRELFDTYGWSANGTLSAPLRVGVVFLTFQALKPYKNIVRVNPARGAERLNDAAPPNTIIYPVKSKHIVCEEYRDGVKRRQIEGEYDCFKNKESEWVCGSSGKLPKITQLD